jgi:hypothetical protein
LDVDAASRLARAADHDGIEGPDRPRAWFNLWTRPLRTCG